MLTLGPNFGRTRSFRGFLIFFADFVAGFFLLIFVGKRCPEKSSRKIPGKILHNLYNKIPDTFLQRGRANFSSEATRWQLGIAAFCRLLLLSVCYATAECEPLI